ncbi:MAG: response regulator [Pseudomonadota bacterium]|jgi:DNA-binding response OmpR family regulator|uniref:Phosphate regulon transcriptional regulatory protein PhoB n=1 Tax=Thalassovita autumnalis TaxID=2072972 RepID=A0A0P1FN61_9RHOB|nr:MULTISPECIES: response regulator [Thalassovita]MEC7962218.1 response regulator [Pseudomonadota bacterium]MEC8040499.1 response regulator [Pseudomonadota bacterium]MEC8294800.1 response regulator [Pseudomonadota bacterium]CUH69699.1 Phosphate regulon transcriptional regulatory protein PhoB [Thalassovita autumnalis]CUH73102.1 Phosphate regulon transcriptional regulatory protein PhoB [Thalassovita autumnalis]|tara:strand:+ start:128 stop:496 length:369 start_codon:yes stop_codon:yes gene_type:complete
MGKHVLVIEDEPNIIEAISFILSRDGWTVATHSNGHDAVDVVRDKSPDLVILDVMLPGKSGYDILTELREGEATRDLPVLMLTARGQSKDRDLAERIGASRFMTKPFSNAEVLEALRELVPQ